MEIVFITWLSVSLHHFYGFKVCVSTQSFQLRCVYRTYPTLADNGGPEMSDEVYLYMGRSKLISVIDLFQAYTMHLFIFVPVLPQ